MIRKSNALSTDPIADRPDKNWMPVKEHGRSEAPKPRGTHQIKPNAVNVTAPNEWDETPTDD